nr:hypothetical protein [Tanacetum cinerariifolium]
SQDIMIIVQNESVIDTSDLLTELERTKERFEKCIIKKETGYAKLWNDWYKKCDECKYDKISYDKAYKDKQQKIKRLQAQLGDLKGKSKDTSSVSDTRNPLSQKLKNENVELEFQVLNYARENAHLKATYKNLFDSISTRIFKINPSKTSREEKHVPNTVSASARTKPITVSQPHVISKNDVNSDLNGLSSTEVDNTKTRRPQPRSNTKHDRVPSTSKSSQSENKEAKVEEHHRNLLLSKNNKHISSAFRFGNDHVAAILGFGDLQWGNIVITSVYFVEGLGHNLFSVGHFCDSDLEVTFRRNACFVRNLEGVDLLKGDRSTNLYIINLHEMASASPICLMARSFPLSLPKFRYHKEHPCPSCDINGKRHVLVIVEDYSRYTWVHLLRSKDKAPEVIIKFLKRITVLLQKPDISFLYVFGALCYPKNNREDIRKLGAKGDIGFFIGYSTDSCAYRVYNRQTKKIMESMNV